MEYRTSDYVELSWMGAETEPFPNGLDELLAANERPATAIESSANLRIGRISTAGLKLDRDKVFSNFGLMLGIFPPATIFLSMLFLTRERSPLMVFPLLAANAATALAAYRFGKVVSRMVGYIERQSTGEYVILSVFIGALWGIIAGGLGGLFLFIIGGVFGTVLGGLVGALALPAFLVPYNAVRQGESIALSHFLPISVGITATICAFILHLANR
jgi:hypothetical protein